MNPSYITETFITPCDNNKISTDPGYPAATPPPGNCPDLTCAEGGHGFPVDTCAYPDGGCPYPYSAVGACCQPPSPTPVVVDVDGSGFHLTSTGDGIWFDFYGRGIKIKLSWTATGSSNAWLVLDRNGNGTIDNGSELFGNVTPQPPSAAPNGFIALAEYDKPANGGNSDGKVTKADAIFSSLRLWQDTNHNGISDVGELHTLKQLGLNSIDLDYKESRRRDEHGNWFRYRAQVKDNRDAQMGRWAWDVFLMRH